uniref:USP domain-containing protein n=1 Tax=Panagrolaimus sp. PS1159 TaxID=55785 RepID=A0AC35FRE8_9BILA
MSSSPANCRNYYNNSTAFNDGTYGMQNLNVSGSSGSYGHQPPKSRTNPDAAFVLRNAVKGPVPIYSAEFFNDYEFRSEDLSLPEWNHEESEKNIPRLYSRPTDKDRHDRIVYERFNNSTQVPLLTNPNAPIVNCVLRALSAVPLLKKIVLSHLCKKPNCMLCEIQFVLRNIYLQEQNNSVAPVTCSAVVREMSAYRDFTIIKQLSPTAFSGLPMSLFCNFFFQHIFSDSQLTYNEITVTESEQFNKLMMISQQTKEACNSCGSIEDYEKTRHIIHLEYSKFFGQVENVPFAQLLEASFEHETDNKFPIQCRKCYRMAGRRRISHNTVLPPVLTIDTDITKTGYAFWVNHADPYNDRPRNSMNGYDSRFVRDGSPHEWLQPTNVFEHSVRGISHAVHSGGHWSHYIPSMISATIDPKNGKVSVSVQISKQPNRKIYSLCSVVMTAADVNNPERFIVACKNQNPTSPLLNWTIFNDYIVTAVKEDEALFTSCKWKMPHLLFYCDIEHLNQKMEPIKIPREVFAYFENSKTKNLSHERAPPPEEGEIVALDSEFIRNEQNENVLGRVSCLNKEGNIVIDDYAMLGCGERISDYLTQYSGIVQEDLDPSLSQKYLLSRKKTYLKVLYLVENKNIFVGHALHNDFKILNIYVPDEQIIDTCQLYRLEGRQFLSLRDLVKIVLGDEIQSHRHDSVEDALCALRLFNKFNEHKEKNSNIESWLQIIYDEAQRHSVSRQRYSPQTGGLENFVLPNNGFLSYMYSPS